MCVRPESHSCSVLKRFYLVDGTVPSHKPASATYDQSLYRAGSCRYESSQRGLSIQPEDTPYQMAYPSE